MPEVIRISPEEALPKMLAGRALLVCAYADNAKFSRYRLEGAIPLSALQDQIGKLPRDQEIIFYCNWKDEHSAASLASQYQELGFRNAKALKDGVEGWKKAGFSIITPP